MDVSVLFGWESLVVPDSHRSRVDCSKTLNQKKLHVKRLTKSAATPWPQQVARQASQEVLVLVHLSIQEQ